MKTANELQLFYQEHLLTGLRVLEQQRRALIRKIFKIAGGIVVTGLCVGGVFLVQARHAGPLVIALILSLLLSGVVGYILFKGYRGQFKDAVIEKLVRFLDDDLRYSSNDGIPKAIFEQSKLFKHSIDSYRCEDRVSGQLGATKMAFSEVHAQYKTRSGKHEHWHTIFKGLFFVADFNKHFRGETTVLPDTAERLFGRLGKKLQSWNIARDQLIKLEDPVFEREFVVYGSDQIEARYILSTSLMQRIMQFKQKTGKRIHLSFIDSSLFVAIPYSKNLFEPRLFRSVLNFRPIADYAEDLQLGIGIVEDLNLNTRIWSKA